MSIELPSCPKCNAPIEHLSLTETATLHRYFKEEKDGTIHVWGVPDIDDGEGDWKWSCTDCGHVFEDDGTFPIEFD